MIRFPWAKSLHPFTGLLSLLILLSLGDRTPLYAQTLETPEPSGDTLTYHTSRHQAPTLLSSYAPYLLIGAISWEQMDLSTRRIRQSHVPHLRVRYDDYGIYAPHLALLGLRALGTPGRSASLQEQYTAHAIATLLTLSVVHLGKTVTHRLRPDGSTYNSFPSGHTATAFVGAELFDLEYGDSHPIWSAANYAIASIMGSTRILNNRHWVSDVIFGALVGQVAAHASYLLTDRWFRSSDQPTLQPALPENTEREERIFWSQNLSIEGGATFASHGSKPPILSRGFLLEWGAGYHKNGKELALLAGIAPQESHTHTDAFPQVGYAIDLMYSQTALRSPQLWGSWSCGIGWRYITLPPSPEKTSRSIHSPILHAQWAFTPWGKENRDIQIFGRLSYNLRQAALYPSWAEGLSPQWIASLGFSRRFYL